MSSDNKEVLLASIASTCPHCKQEEGFALPDADALEAETQRQFEAWDKATGTMLDSLESKVYIAGPMTGYDNFNRDAFNFQEARFKHLGYAVMNPAVLGDGFTHEEYMKVAIAMLRCCDIIAVLPGFEKSKGAMMEIELAKELEMAFIYI